jgi:DNA-binding CsgD family transcriptional regulator
MHPMPTMLQKSRLGPSDFAPILDMPRYCVLARDTSMRLLWCNEQYSQILNTTVEKLIGSHLRENMEPVAADERQASHDIVMTTEISRQFSELRHGWRFITRAWPLERSAFNANGIIVALFPSSAALPEDAPFCALPDFGDLAILSRRELDVLYHLSRGLNGPEIAEYLHRSEHTVRDHIKSIHGKLRVHHRGALVRLAIERGLQGFTPTQWAMIIKNHRVTD